MLIGIIKSSRPKQWIKNLMVLFPLLFSFNESWFIGSIDHALGLFTGSTLTILAFVLASSSIYLINDLADIEQDSRHPMKKKRPVVSGVVGRKTAVVSSLVLAITGISISSVVAVEISFYIFGYVILMIMYSFVLKNIVLLDVFCISAGFIIRVVVGAAAISVPISPWLYVCTGFGSLFVALSKRVGEISVYGPRESVNRKVIQKYDGEFGKNLIAMTLTSTLISYCLYTVTASNLPANNSMMLTIPLVVFGMFRYMYLVTVKGEGEKPEEPVLKDSPLLTCVLGWASLIAAILYFYR